MVDWFIFILFYFILGQTGTRKEAKARQDWPRETAAGERLGEERTESSVIYYL